MKEAVLPSRSPPFAVLLSLPWPPLCSPKERVSLSPEFKNKVNFLLIVGILISLLLFSEQRPLPLLDLLFWLAWFFLEQSWTQAHWLCKNCQPVGAAGSSYGRRTHVSSSSPSICSV